MCLKLVLAIVCLQQSLCVNRASTTTSSSAKLLQAEDAAKKSEALLQKSDQETDAMLAKFHKEMLDIQKSLSSNGDASTSFLQEEGDPIKSQLDKLGIELREEQAKLQADEENEKRKLQESQKESSLLQMKNEGSSENFQKELKDLQVKFEKELNAVTSDNYNPLENTSKTPSFLQRADSNVKDASFYEAQADKSLSLAESSLRKLDEDLARSEKELKEEALDAKKSPTSASAEPSSSFLQRSDTSSETSEDKKLDAEIDRLESKVKDEINALKNNDLSYFEKNKSTPSFIQIQDPKEFLSVTDKSIDAAQTELDKIAKDLEAQRASILSEAQKAKAHVQSLMQSTNGAVVSPSFIETSKKSKILSSIDDQIERSNLNLKQNEDALKKMQEKFDEEMKSIEAENAKMFKEINEKK